VITQTSQIIFKEHCKITY